MASNLLYPSFLLTPPSLIPSFLLSILISLSLSVLFYWAYFSELLSLVWILQVLRCSWSLTQIESHSFLPLFSLALWRGHDELIPWIFSLCSLDTRMSCWIDYWYGNQPISESTYLSPGEIVFDIFERRISHNSRIEARRTFEWLIWKELSPKENIAAAKEWKHIWY